MTRRPAACRRALIAGAAALTNALGAAAAAQTAPAQPGAARAAPPTTQMAPLLERRERGSLVYDNIPPADPALAARITRYLQSRQASLLDWVSDGSLLIATRFGETEQVHRVAAPLHAREQLTFYPEPVNFARA